MLRSEVASTDRRNYYLLILAMIAMQVTTSTIYMVLPIFFAQYGISKSGNGVLIAIGTFAGIFSSLIAGRFSDTRGRKPVLFFGVALYSLVFFLFALMSKDFNTFFALRFLEGFAFYMTPVAVTAMAADIFPSRQRGKAMALYSMASGVGQFFGPIMAGVLVPPDMGSGQPNINFNNYFIFCGVFVAISAGIIFFFVKETLPHELKAKPRDGKPGGFDVRGFLTSIKGLGVIVAIFLIGILVQRIGYTMVNPFFSIYLEEELGLNVQSMSFFFAIRAICTLIFSPLAGMATDKYGRKPTFILGSLALAGTMLGYRQVSTYEHVLIVRVMESTSNAIMMPTTRAYMADLMRPEVRGFGLGIYTTVIEESSTLGAVFGGVIAEVYSFGAIFLIGSVTAALCAVIVFIGVPEPKELPHHDDYKPKVTAEIKTEGTR